MRWSPVFASVGLATLVSVGVALGHLAQEGTQAATATFSAARERADVRMCTGPDGIYELVKGRYAGQSESGQPALAGPVVLTVKSVFNTTERIGWITGSLKIGAGDHRTRARLVGTLTQGASPESRIVDGFVDGPAGGHGTKVFGNVTASFSGAGGFSAGRIGEGGANIALLAGRVCKPATLRRIEISGRIEALTTSSITVRSRRGSALTTCQIRPGISPSTGGLRAGDRVEIVCGPVDGSLTLLRMKKKGRDDDDD